MQELPLVDQPGDPSLSLQEEKRWDYARSSKLVESLSGPVITAEAA